MDEKQTSQIEHSPLFQTRRTMRASGIQQFFLNDKNLYEFFRAFSEGNSSDAESKFAVNHPEKMIRLKIFFFMSLYCHVMNPLKKLICEIQFSTVGALGLESKCATISLKW